MTDQVPWFGIYIFGNGVRMIYPVNSLRHENSLLLSGKSLPVIAHYVIQPSEHSETLRDLRMHSAVDVVQQIQCFADQFVSVLQVSLLNLALTCRVKVVRVAGLKNEMRKSR